MRNSSTNLYLMTRGDDRLAGNGGHSGWISYGHVSWIAGGSNPLESGTRSPLSEQWERRCDD